MTQYIVNIIIFQLIFLIAYDLFHKKDTFFSLNRIYLILSSVLSLVLPFIKIESIRNTIPEEYIVKLPTVFIGQQYQIDPTVEAIQSSIILDTIEHMNWWLLIYSIGVMITSFLFAQKSIRLYKLRKQSRQEKIKNYNLITLDNSKDAFSFWNTIYLGDQIANKEREQIIVHEIIHLKEKHSLDLLWFEFLKIVFWFNPLIYIYQSKINMLHEFIADAKSANVFGKRKYSEQLLNVGFDTEKIKFINQFFSHSIMKKRFNMLLKTKSKSAVRFKYLSMIPILMAMITFSSFSKKTAIDQTTTSFNDILKPKTESISETPEKIKDAEPEPKISTPKKGSIVIPTTSKKEPESTKENPPKITIDSTKKGIPFAKIDQIPTTETCKDLTDKSEMKKCVSNGIKQFVNTNFKASEMKKYAEPGINRIYVRFKIDKTGIITGVEARGSSPELEKEAKRVVESIPKMIPGELNGEKVTVLYSLPIVFNNGLSDLTKQTNEKNITTEATILSEGLSEYKNHTIKSGYYLVSNIFKHKSYLEKRIKKLKELGLTPKVLKNPKDKYYYVYFKRSDDLETVKKMLTSNLDGKYDGDLFILKINAE